MVTDREIDDRGFRGVDKTKQITLGPIVFEEDATCELCGDGLSVGTRTYLVGGRIGREAKCCRLCAIEDGASPTADQLDTTTFDSELVD